MIHADVGRLVVLKTVVRERVIVGQRAVGRQRIERHVLRRDRIEPCGGNDVARERRPRRRRRIVDRRRELREITRPHFHSRHGDEERHALLQPIAFVVDKKERLIFFDRSPQAAAVLVLAGERLALGEEEPRIESLVTTELESGAMELVAPRFREDVDDSVYRIRAPQRSARAADDLNLRDVFQRKILRVPIDAAKLRRVHASSINQHQHLVGRRVIESARTDSPLVRINLGHFQVGHQAQRLGKACGARAPNVLLRNDLDRRRRFRQFFRTLGN